MVDEEFRLPDATGPIPGASPPGYWVDYFRALKASRADLSARQQVEMLQHEVRVKGRQIGTESVSGRTMLGRILKLATENSWEVRVGESEYYSGDVYVKSTDTVRPGELKKHQWLQGIKHGHGFLWSKDHAILDGKRVNNDELRIALEEL